METARN